MNVIAIHMALQPDGSVLFYGSNREGGQDGTREYGFWTPEPGNESGRVTMLPNSGGTNIFCSAQILLQDGSTLIAGGQRPAAVTMRGTAASNVVDGTRRTISTGSEMLRPRWYGSAMTLMNGETYIQGGEGGTDRPEIRAADGRHRLLSGVDTSGLWYAFPRNYVAPDGRVFGVDGEGRMYFVDATGEGRLTAAGRLPDAVYGEKAAMAQFRPGRFLRMGDRTPEAIVIDIRAGDPRHTATESLSSARADGVATVLPDGRVLLTGGSGQHNILERAAKSAEVWDPVSGEWTIGPELRNARLYHGSALLLHDGRVMVAGGGAYGPLTNRNGEIYSPSYLFDASGRRATQTTLTAAPTVIEPGRSFPLQVAAGSISRVTLVRFGTMSHSWTGDQTFVDLPFRADAANASAAVAQLPATATSTPPGFYLLFAFDERGVPSIARTLRILPPEDGRSGAQAAAASPVISQIGDQDWSARSVTLQPWGYGRRGLPLRWSASGLPPGVSIDAVSGAVTGAPARPGDYHVTIAADDGVYVGSTSFVARVEPPRVRLDPPVSTGPATAGRATRFTARAVGEGLTYEWNFGDGTVSGRTASPTVEHVFRSSGMFSVTVTVYDRNGRPVTGSFTQLVSDEVVPRPATRSSMMAWTGSGAASRIWVVNPDSDTVSGFDAATGSRIAELAVPRQPVTVTAAGDGRLWVASRRGDALTVIDPATAAVVRTIPLARGSLPYGIAGDPAGRRVWVALEGRGRLLRYEVESGQSSGEVELGPDIRHVSVSGDSRVVLVSRFITAPLPGESTAAVRTDGSGGEVLRVDAGTLVRLGTVVLGHSDRVDAENAGRGIPNYLGAVAISPDGRQAFVPSKQDNVRRGRLRDGLELDFQNTVRAVSSRIDLATMTEDPTQRIDHDNASVASAAVFDPRGTLLFVALETSREVAVVDASTRAQLLRVETGRAPQGLLVAPDGSRLYVANFMDRSIDVFDLTPLLVRGRVEMPRIATLAATGAEKLPQQVLVGKRLFYDARDPRLARDRYMSCASCHADGGHDGRTWDLTGIGEGLRNTLSLRGRGGMRAGPVHWSGNFDEVQDFEGQIRAFAGGTGLLSDADLAVGSRSRPLGDPKAGLSPDLDALAAYVGSLVETDPVPSVPRPWWWIKWPFAERFGATVFEERCATCHAGPIGTDSAPGGGHDVGTLTAASGKRLGARLDRLDTPSLADAWQTAPYLHDGSAPTIEAAVRRHVPDLSPGELDAVAAFVREGARDVLRPSRVMEGAEVTLVGTAAPQADGRIRMTDGFGQRAGVWSTRRWSTHRAFSSTFDFTLDGDRPHADGLAFVLHGGPSNSIGLGGGCLGACGLPGWLAASLHTWTYNSGGWEGEGLARGARPLGFDAGGARRIVGRMSVTWNPAQNRLSMTVSMLADGTPRRFTDSVTLDLRARFGDAVTIGLAAATGGGRALQHVSGWTVTDGVVAPRREGEREEHGGWAASAPECVSWGELRIDCMVVGGDGALYQRWSTDAGRNWNGWIRLGGALAAERPACVSVGDQRLDCFAVGADRALWQLRWDGVRWWNWRSLGGWLSAAPSCVASRSGAIDCFVRGGDRALWHIGGNGEGLGTWSTWRWLGGVLDSAPACTNDLSGVARCFARGIDGAMLQSSAAGDWRNHGGWIQGEPSCATRGDGLTSCFVRGSDNGLWRADFDGVSWQGWRAEPRTAGRVGAAPRCVANRARDGIDCALVSADGVLRLFTRDGGGPLEGSWPLRALAVGRVVEAPGCVARTAGVDCASRDMNTRSVNSTGATVD